MMNTRKSLRLSCFGLAACAVVCGQEAREILVEHLTPQSEIEHNLEKGVSVGRNGVVVTQGTNAVLVADFMTLEQGSGWVTAEGNVQLQSAGKLWRGESLRYNFNTEEMSAADFRIGMRPFFAGGKGLEANQTNQVYSAEEAYVTTDDVSDPAYRVRAKKLKIIPGKSIEADQATVYLGNVPVMYFPHYKRSLERHPNHFVLTPGYRSSFGPYLLTDYNWIFSTNLSGTINIDYRQKRGIAGGPDFSYDLGRAGKGAASAYFTRDEEPGNDPAGNPIQDDRRRIQFSHRATIQTNFTITAVANNQSDAYVARDFFESIYRKDPQPKTYLEVTKAWPNFTLDLLAQPQLNDFFQAVERLPDVRLSAIRQQLGVSPFYYEGENSVGYFRFSPEESSALEDYSAMRADSLHQILLPQTYFGWLNVVPRVGGRFTYYGETDGYGSTLEEQDRFVFNTGAEVSTKMSRVWSNAKSKFWDADGIRHIFQPSVNYVFVPTPSKAPAELPQFDSEIPSLRLLPIDFPDYNAIDSIDSQNVLRFTLRNKVQTKRSEKVDNIVNWALYTDWRLDPRPNQDTFADFFSDLDFKPREWLTLSSELRYDIAATDIRLANHTATVQPNDVWSVSLGHLYVNEPDFGPDSDNNLVRSSIYYRLNENWGVRMTHHFEARDGTLEEQYYTIYRDMRSWTSALTFRVRDQRAGATDFTVALTFSLKAFPRFKVGRDRDEHSLLLGS